MVWDVKKESYRLGKTMGAPAAPERATGIQRKVNRFNWLNHKFER
jgi:hypothetical protein